MIHRKGLTYVTVKLTAPAGSRRPYSASFLIDTGATDSMAPAKELRKAGIKPVGKTAYELADRQVKEFHFGLAKIEFMGEITSGRVISRRCSSRHLSGCVWPRV